MKVNLILSKHGKKQNTTWFIIDMTWMFLYP